MSDIYFKASCVIQPSSFNLFWTSMLQMHVSMHKDPLSLETVLLPKGKP